MDLQDLLRLPDEMARLMRKQREPQGRPPVVWRAAGGGQDAALLEPPALRPRVVNPWPDLERLGIPADAVEMPKTPVVENGAVVGYNAKEPALRPRRFTPPQFEVPAPELYTRTPPMVAPGAFDEGTPPASLPPLFSVPPPKLSAPVGLVAPALPAPAPALYPSPQLQPSAPVESVLAPRSSRPPMLPEDYRRSKRLPELGEQAANDEVFARRLGQYPQLAVPAPGESATLSAPPPGVAYGLSRPDLQPSAGAARRERVERPLEFLETRAREDLTRPVVDHNGGLKSTLIGAWRGFLRGVAQTGSLGGGVGGAATGAVTHGLDHSLDERHAAGELFGDDLARLGAARQMEAAGLKAEGQRTDNAWKAARPDIELAKREDARAKAGLQAVLSNLRLLKGQRLDSTNPRHLALLQRAADAGIYVDPDEWNDAKDNLVPVEVIDPQNLTATRKMLLNKVTGETSDYGQGRYVQPVDQKTGMTPYQTGSLTLGGARFGETRRHNQVTEAQGSERIGISRQNLDLSAERNLISWKSYQSRQDNIDFREKRTHYTEARKLIEKHNQHTASANRYAGYKGEDGKQPQWARLKQEEQEALADSTRDELESVYGDVYQEGSGQGFPAPPQPTVAAPAQAPAPRGRVSRANFGKFREQNPQYAQMDDEQIEQLLRSQGVEVY
jgi:hypothetical protein